jgi:hypothetical protein
VRIPAICAALLIVGGSIAAGETPASAAGKIDARSLSDKGLAVLRSRDRFRGLAKPHEYSASCMPESSKTFFCIVVDASAKGARSEYFVEAKDSYAIWTQLRAPRPNIFGSDV